MYNHAHLRLLVVRLGAMGDIVHALPAVTALRFARPEWQLDWVVDPRWRALFQSGTRALETASTAVPDRRLQAVRDSLQPIIDRLHFAPTRDWGRQPLATRTRREVVALRRDLRAARYDLVLDLQGSIKSAVVARLAGARRIVGERSPRERAAGRLYTERVETRAAHVIDQDLELVSYVAGEKLPWARPLLPEDPEAEAWCNALLESGSARPVALIAPGAGWGAKRWPAERYAEVARGLLGRGMRVLVNAVAGEEPLAREIEQGTGGAALPVTTSLDELIALTRRVALLIGGDTGPLHLACALARPVVGIYGPTDPSRNGPYGTRFTVLRSPLSRRDHTRRAEPEAGLLTILPDAVLRAADELLEKVEAQ